MFIQKGEIMLNKITFCGRETMLTSPLKKAASDASEYVRASKIYSDEEIAKTQKLLEDAKQAMKAKDNNGNVYTSPFDIIPDSVIKEQKPEYKQFDVMA